MRTKDLVSKYRHIFNTDYTEDANCKGAWLFTEGSGTTVDDSSANSNVGNFKGTGEPAWDTTDVDFNTLGSAPNSVDFDGTDDYIVVKSSPLISTAVDSSVVWWMEGDNGSDLALYCERGASGNDIWKIETHNSKLQFTHRDDAGTLDQKGSTSFTSSAGFAHFALTKDGTAIAWYRNGVADGTGTLTGTDTFTNTLSCRLGGDQADASADYNGKMTDVAVFNKTLTSTEINEIYDYGLKGASGGGTTANVVADLFSLAASLKNISYTLDWIKAQPISALTSALLTTTVKFNYIVAPSIFSVTATLKDPTVNYGYTIIPTPQALTLSSPAPTLKYDYLKAVAVSALTAALLDPTAQAGTFLEIDPLNLTSALLSPTAKYDYLVSLAVQSISSALQDTTVNFDFAVDISALALTLGLFDPTVSTSTGRCYFVYNSANTSIDFYVGGNLAMRINADGSIDAKGAFNDSTL